MCIPDGNPINEVLRHTEIHMDNLRQFLPGLLDELSEDFVKLVQTGEESLDAAHNYQVRAT